MNSYKVLLNKTESSSFENEIDARKFMNVLIGEHILSGYKGRNTRGKVVTLYNDNLPTPKVVVELEECED